jgi:hypothetical protein
MVSLSDLSPFDRIVHSAFTDHQASIAAANIGHESCTATCRYRRA